MKWDWMNWIVSADLPTPKEKINKSVQQGKTERE